MRWKRRAACVVLTAVFLIVLPLIWLTREPSYQGEALTSWVEKYSDAPLDQTNSRAEAREAIRAIGGRRAVPRLLRMAEASDGPIRQWLIEKNERWQWREFPLVPAEMAQVHAVDGFEALGTNGALGVPELSRLLEDTNHAFVAVRCLIGVGSPAKTAVCAALTNRNPLVREFAVSGLASMFDDDGPYLDEMKRILDSTDGDMRMAAVNGIGAQTQAPEKAVPLLIRALHDPNPYIGASAASYLGEFGTNLEVAAALTDVVRSENKQAAIAALKSLVKISPGEALPILLEDSRSLDKRKRSFAFSLLRQFPISNPAVRQVAEETVKDPDPMVSQRAKEWLTTERRKEHPEEFVIPEGPSYGGKTLGEWLMERKRDGQFSTGAEKAIRELGTNAIPVLLERLVYTLPPYGLRTNEINSMAAGGLAILGEQAEMAFPTLETLMDGKDQYAKVLALVAGCGAGEKSIPIFRKALTNDDSDLRNEAVNLLTEGPSAHNPKFRIQAKEMLASLLNDPDQMIRLNASNSLSEINGKLIPRRYRNGNVGPPPP